MRKAGRENPGLFFVAKLFYVPGTSPRTVVATIVGEPTVPVVLKRKPLTVTGCRSVRPVISFGVRA